METWWTGLPQVQQRIVTELLGWEAPRPAVDRGLVTTLHTEVERRTQAALEVIPRGKQLSLAKAALDALACDGRFLDRQDSPFEYSPAMVRGQLAHTAITLDLAGRRTRPPAEVVSEAWAVFAAGSGPAAAYARDLGGVEVDALQGAATQIMLEFRDTFPLLPTGVPIRAEPALAAPLHDGRIRLFGRPDFVLGRVDGDRRLMLLLDLKSGKRNATHDRAELRFYALLATLKYGVAPFRAATFYLDDATWAAEDVTTRMLRTTAIDVAAKAVRAAMLTYRRPVDGDLQLVPGPACRWCTRAATCSAVRPRALTAA